MPEENVSQAFILENIDKTRSFLIKEINQNKLMSKKYKKDCRVWNYIEYLLILISTVAGCVSISAFASLVGIPLVIMSSVIELTSRVCVQSNAKISNIQVFSVITRKMNQKL